MYREYNKSRELNIPRFENNMYNIKPMTTGGSAIKVLMIIMVRSRPKNFFVDRRKPIGTDTKNSIKTALNDTLKEVITIFRKAMSYINRSTNDGYKLFIY